MSDEQRDRSWDADPATPEQLQLVERVCNGLGFEGYFDTTCGWWRNEWNRPVFVPVVRSIALAYEFGRIDAHGTEQAGQQTVEPMLMALCESQSVVLREGQPYVFRPVDDCEKCAVMSADSREAYGEPQEPQPAQDEALPRTEKPAEPQCGKGCFCLAQCGDVYAHASDAVPPDIDVSSEPEIPPDGYVIITTNEAGECVAVTRNDEEGRILRTIWKRPADSAPSARQAMQPAEHVDGVLQGEWVITGPDGSTFRGATPFRAALLANRHRVQTDPMAAKQFQDAIEQGRREADEENARLIAEHGTLNCPACGGSGHLGDALAASPAPAAEPVPYTRSPFKNGSQWVTFNIRAEHADRAARALDGAPAACEACRENSANKHFLDALASAADGEGSEL